MAAKKKGKTAARKSSARPARKAAKKTSPDPRKKTTAKARERGGDRSGIVYSDPRREALVRRLLRT